MDAAGIQAQYPFSFADACAAATAMRFQAELMAGGSELKRVEHRIKIRWL